ncbi:winged helix-turn-helix transcriptional regulator [Parasphingorhabdus sp. JC815]|uniref:winged helix-turn-helix transcriptional regulator n=1 Tax=Parasphingorhabdus sp. JC815 TaxID=3232140 RepID=UPI003458B709
MKKREYNDGCATAHALDIVGERWALLIMRELMLGPKRFSDLRASLPGISANLLTQRLEGLESVSVLRRRKLPPPAASWVYELTEWGLESEKMIKEIGRWAARSPNMVPGKQMSVNSVILSLRTMFNADLAEGLDFTLGMRLGEQEFITRISQGMLEIDHGEASRGDVLLICDQNALAATVYGGVPLDQLIDDGAIQIKGDKNLLERFCRLFPLPDTAPDLHS